MSQKLEIKQDLDDMATAVAEINATQVGIAELRKKYAKVLFAVDTIEGITAARAARAEIRTPRYSIEHLRKAAKAPVLALGSTIDSMAADLTAEILALETPIDNQIKAEEQRIEDEKQAAIDAEEQRIATIQDRIRDRYDKVNAVTIQISQTSGFVAKCIEAYRADPIDDSYEEFKDDAARAWQAGMDRLEVHLAAVVAREAEDARLAAERAELEQLREADEKRRQEDAENAAEAERQRQEKEAEERKKLDEQRAEQEAAQEKIDAEEKRIADEAEALEQKKRDANAAAAAVKAAEDARQVAAQEAARKAVYPGDEAIVAALSQHFGVPTEVAQKWVAELKGEQQ